MASTVAEWEPSKISSIKATLTDKNCQNELQKQKRKKPLGVKGLGAFIWEKWLNPSKNRELGGILPCSLPLPILPTALRHGVHDRQQPARLGGTEQLLAHSSPCPVRRTSLSGLSARSLKNFVLKPFPSSGLSELTLCEWFCLGYLSRTILVYNSASGALWPIGTNKNLNLTPQIHPPTFKVKGNTTMEWDVGRRCLKALTFLGV